MRFEGSQRDNCLFLSFFLFLRNEPRRIAARSEWRNSKKLCVGEVVLVSGSYDGEAEEVELDERKRVLT